MPTSFLCGSVYQRVLKVNFYRITFILTVSDED